MSLSAQASSLRIDQGSQFLLGFSSEWGNHRVRPEMRLLEGDFFKIRVTRHMPQCIWSCVIKAEHKK